jgi:hypothetical protein
VIQKRIRWEVSEGRKAEMGERKKEKRIEITFVRVSALMMTGRGRHLFSKTLSMLRE